RLHRPTLPACSKSRSTAPTVDRPIRCPSSRPRGVATEIHTTFGTGCRSVRRHGPLARLDGTESTFQPEKGVVVLMPYEVRSATRGHRPLPGGSDAVTECRGGIRRWSG